MTAAPVRGTAGHYDFWQQQQQRDASARGASAAPARATWGLKLRNPTIYNASVCVFVEETADRGKVLAVNAMDLCKRVMLPAGGQAVLPM